MILMNILILGISIWQLSANALVFNSHLKGNNIPQDGLEYRSTSISYVIIIGLHSITILYSLIVIYPAYRERDGFLSANIGLFIYYAVGNCILCILLFVFRNFIAGGIELIYILIGVVGAVLTNRLIQHLKTLKYEEAVEQMTNRISGNDYKVVKTELGQIIIFFYC